MTTPFKKAIHLLYVPTIFCNMGCKYCYLGELTEAKPDYKRAVSTLEHALKGLLEAGYLPFNLSFHGGEVTSLPTPVLRELFEISKGYYQKYGDDIHAMGHKRNPLHIKTNLYNFSKHYELLNEFEVSISASIDLPLSLHEKYRVDKKGASTLPRILDNLRLLVKYPHRKKISCVVTQEHFHKIDQFIEDIKYLHQEIGLDMNRFNIMFSFDSLKNNEKFEIRDEGLTMLTQQQQVEFYQRLNQAFAGTALEAGLRNEWFCEFTPDYCCSAVNCGDKFFLLQDDGDVYSCPRGQSSEKFFYGNVFKDEVDTIINNGWQLIERNESEMVLSDDCLQCDYQWYCNSGCTFVRSETGMKKSYTCELQKAIYRDNPERYPPMSPQQMQSHGKKVLFHNNIHKIETHFPKKEHYITPEISDPKNSLRTIISEDKVLTELFGNRLFYVEINGVHYDLESPILRNVHDIELFGTDTQAILGVHNDVFELACKDAVNNHVLLMMLRDTTVVYGDEGRSKQEHIFDYALYSQSLQAVSDQAGDYWRYDLSTVLRSHAALYQSGVRNILYVTTKAMREYHYAKHKKNAFYHIQAINLPFPNFEFYWKENE